MSTKGTLAYFDENDWEIHIYHECLDDGIYMEVLNKVLGIDYYLRIKKGHPHATPAVPGAKRSCRCQDKSKTQGQRDNLPYVGYDPEHGSRG